MSRRRKNRRGPGQIGGSGPALNGDIIDPATGRPIRLIRGGENIQLGDMDADEPENQPVTATFRLKHPKKGVLTFRVNPDLTELMVVDLLEEAQGIKQDDPKSMTMTKKYALEHIHPADRVLFWETVRAKNWDSGQVMVHCWKLLDGITAQNPTGERSDSSDGPLETSPSSEPASSTPVVDPSDPLSMKRAAFLKHIDKIQARTDEDGQVLPINAAIAAQLAATARAQGIDLGSPSQAATG